MQLQLLVQNSIRLFLFLALTTLAFGITLSSNASFATDAAISISPHTTMTPLPGSSPRNHHRGESSDNAANAEVAAFSGDLKRHCMRHFPGRIQGELRNACASPGETFAIYGKSLSQVRCRVNYGEEPRLVMACLIGVSISADMTDHISPEQNTSFVHRLQLCAEQYPQHTEIDAFLQESCLTGIYLHDLMSTEGLKGFELCGQLSPERSFLGPCAVGYALYSAIATTSDANAITSAVTKQNQFCEKYFDHRRFHLTYRACLNARSFSFETSADSIVSLESILQNCANIVSDPSNDNERAACVVGSVIQRSLAKSKDISARFQKCGEVKVSYQDRDVLACLTAASLTDINPNARGEKGCKDIFKSAKSVARIDCVNSLALFDTSDASASQSH